MILSWGRLVFIENSASDCLVMVSRSLILRLSAELSKLIVVERFRLQF